MLIIQLFYSNTNTYLNVHNEQSHVLDDASSSLLPSGSSSVLESGVPGDFRRLALLGSDERLSVVELLSSESPDVLDMTLLFGDLLGDFSKPQVMGTLQCTVSYWDAGNRVAATRISIAPPSV